MASESIGLFIFIKLYMEKLITQFGDKGLENMAGVLIPAVSTMVSVWVMFEGYRILNGQSREPVTALFWKTGKVVVITAVAGWIMSNTGDIRSWLNDHIKDSITAVIAGKEYDSPESMVDATLVIMQMVMAAFGAIGSSMQSEQGSSMSTFISMSGISQGAPAVVAGSLLLLNQVALSLSIMTAPAFILCLLYEPTKGYFQGWLKFTLSTLLTLAVLTAMVVIALKVVLVYGSAVLAQYKVAANILSGSKEGIAQTTMMQGGLGLMMSTLMVTVPPMAVGLLNGSMGTFISHNPFDGNNKKTDASGNVMGGSQEASDKNIDSSGSTRTPNINQSTLPQNKDNNVDTVKSNETSVHGSAAQSNSRYTSESYQNIAGKGIGDDSAAIKQKYNSVPATDKTVTRGIPS